MARTKETAVPGRRDCQKEKHSNLCLRHDTPSLAFIENNYVKIEQKRYEDGYDGN